MSVVVCMLFPSLRVELRDRPCLLGRWFAMNQVVCWSVTGEPAIQPTGRWCLAAEAVEGLALALEGVDHVHGGDGLAAGVLGVGHGVTDDVLEEDLEDTAGLGGWLGI